MNEEDDTAGHMKGEDLATRLAALEEQIARDLACNSLSQLRCGHQVERLLNGAQQLVQQARAIVAADSRREHRPAAAGRWWRRARPR
jgi:hypothetical protein